MILVVSLDLLGPAASYDPLYEALKAQGTWAHYMRWTWLLDTSHTPDQVVEALRPHIQTGDKMLIAPLTRPYQGLLTKEGWTWVNTRMSTQLDQVTKVEPPAPTLVPPMGWIPPIIPQKLPTGVVHEVSVLAEGAATLQWPATLSKESVQELQDWLELVIKKLKRRYVDDPK